MNLKIFAFAASVFILTLLSTFQVNAQEIDMSGTVRFDRSGSWVSLSAGRIENYGLQGSMSGTLVLQLWATSAPYYGQSILTGYKLAEANLGTLWGGYYLSDINRTVVFNEPPQGYYTAVLVVGEWDGSKFITVDWFNFAGVQNFGGLPPYTPPPVPPALDLIDEYVGIWEGTQTLQLNGTSYESTGTSVISRYENRGFYSKAVVRMPGQLLAEAEAWQFDNGTMYGVVKSGGAVIGTITGTWFVIGRSIISNVSAVAGNTSYTQYINHSFTDSETMLSSGATSYGATSSGILKKVSKLPFSSLAPSPPSIAVTPVSSGGGGGGGGGPAQVQKSKKGGKSSSVKKSGGGSSKKASASKSSGGKKSGGKKAKKK
jgi:hypothetical protein